ncbi:FAD:protein FMN transferase [Dyella flagellata]|uniref:FAD:protein FMN transferase n=1 Tax=Dyella flagellata TaxID=1867833 RepID=A0ABQ5X8Z3_9GAMM|nr:FAD:protein FMN transferase [Dyella flagellata]GLQ87646.1 FAD:protein FMN transferase [Dyella flagellata]
MPSCSPNSTLERVQPLLGTFVSVRVEADDAKAGHRAIDAAFEAIARVHALMSFHAPQSDLSRIHRAPAGMRVVVEAQTAEVLRLALAFSKWSEGSFDITIAGKLVAQGLLPAPSQSRAPDTNACWRDIELDDGHGVVLHHPLWIDLGGIAKGYAVDRAVACLQTHGIRNACVNAGGDLRLLGAGPHRVVLDTGVADLAQQPVLEVDEAAVATSSSRAFAASGISPHVHGQTQACIGMQDCVSVVANLCAHADALTKIVLASREACEPLLKQLGATAYLHDAHGQWSTLGVAA